MAYSCNLPEMTVMDYHGLSWTIVDYCGLPFVFELGYLVKAIFKDIQIYPVVIGVLDREAPNHAFKDSSYL